MNTDLHIVVPQNVASIVKLFVMFICLNMTTRPVASLHFFTWNLQPRNQNLSGDCRIVTG